MSVRGTKIVTINRGGSGAVATARNKDPNKGAAEFVSSLPEAYGRFMTEKGMRDGKLDATAKVLFDMLRFVINFNIHVYKQNTL